MLIDKYFLAVEALANQIKETQRENIAKAALLIADSVKSGGAVHVHDTGHIINAEMIGRAGGLMLMKQLNYSFNVDNPVRVRNRDGIQMHREGFARYVLSASNVLPGDVMIIGSVSGKSLAVVDLALAAKEIGVKLIVLTSVEYSSNVESDHSSGKRLFELGDVVLDNCAPIGDAMMQVDRLEPKICPASGISAALIMWAITAATVEKLLEHGVTPSIYKSANYPGGIEYNEKLLKGYNENGI